MPTIFLYNFDKDVDLLSFLDKFWEKDKDYFLLYSISDESLRIIKEFAQNQEVFIFIKDKPSFDDPDNVKLLSDFVTSLDSTLNSSELSKVYLFYLLFDSDLYITPNLYNNLSQLKNNTPFLKAVIFFSDKTETIYLNRAEIISNFASLLTLIKYSSYSHLSQLSLFEFPSTFRLCLISVPLLEDMNLYSLVLINQVISGYPLSLLEKQEIQDISSNLYSNLKDNIQIQLRDLPNLESLSSRKEPLFIYNFDLFQNEILKDLETKFNLFSQKLADSDLLTLINLKNELIKEEKLSSDFNKIECLYVNLLSKFQDDLKIIFSEDTDLKKIFSDFKEQIKQKFINIFNVTSFLRKKLESFKKIIISIAALFLILFLLDFIFFHFPFKYKIAFLALILLSFIFTFFSHSLRPKLKLKRAYYQFLKELRPIDNNLVKSINNYCLYIIKKSLERRFESFSQIRQKIINKIEMRIGQKKKQNYGFGYYPISIKESFDLEASDFSSIRAEFFNRIIEAIDLYDNYDIVSEEIIENITAYTREFLQNKIATLNQFWGREYREIENLLDNLSLHINSKACLPFIVGCDVQETKFIIAKPQNPPDFLNKNWAIPITLDSDRDIIFGIWGILKRSKETPKEIPGKFDKKYVWTYKGVDYKLDFKISKDSYFKFKKKARRLVIEQYGKIYVTGGINDEVRNLASILDKLGGYTTKYDRAAFLVSFVQQNVTYKHETGEYPRYPIETLVDQAGDCEDFAILGAALLKCLGFDTCLIYLIDVCHISLGIAGIEDFSGDYHEYQGMKFYHCELAGTAWEIGKIPDEWRHSRIRIIPIPDPK